MIRTLETARTDDELRAAIRQTISKPENFNLTYGPGHPEHSYFRDKALFELQQYLGVSPRLAEARERLEAHDREMMAFDPERRMRCIEDRFRSKMDQPGYRSPTVEREKRAASTASASMGSFTPPTYWTESFALYVQYFATVLGQCYRPFPLPESGMSIVIPALTASTSVTTQSSENTAIATSSPTSSNLTIPLETFAGAMVASYQIIDRGGQEGGMGFDQELALQFAVDYATSADAYVIGLMLTAPQSVSYTDTAFNLNKFWQQVGDAAYKVESAAGSRLVATHGFYTPQLFRTMAGASDTAGRPIFGPECGGVRADGSTGTSVACVPSFVDGVIPNANSEAQAIIANMPANVWAWESEPVVTVVAGANQSGTNLATQGSYWFGYRRYAAATVRYPNAVAVVSGTGLSTSYLVS